MRRFCLLAAGTAWLWAVAVMVTGGFVVSAAGVRVSSRSAVNPLLFALVASVAAWAVSPRGQRGRVLAADLQAFGAPAALVAMATIVVVIGFTFGALVVGGADSYGYVSLAEKFASGSYRFDEPLIREFAGRLHPDSLVPLGYTAVGEHGVIVPMYAPGLPMLLAVFRYFGGRDSVFLVVPLLAVMALLSTYVMGRRLSGQAAGVAAAALLAASPSFLFQLTAAPLSDLPVTAWWAVTLSLLLFDSRTAALLAGGSASAAILTRPNLVPLALVILLALLWTAWRQRSTSHRGLQRAMLFVAGVVPGCVVVGIMNWLWYGSALISGYGRASDLYSWTNLGANLLRYPGWVLESQSPVVLLAVATPWLVTGVRDGRVPPGEMRLIAQSWLGFIFAVLASYVFYEPFDDWWFVRFMLPAFPPLLVLTVIAIIAATARLPQWPRIVVPVALLAMVTWYELAYASSHNALDARGERKYAIAGAYVAQRLPSNAILLSMIHSGSIRYYSGRPTVRFDVIPPEQLDSTLEVLAGSGYRPYFVLEPFEVAMFQQQYAGHSTLAALDWLPVDIVGDSRTRIFDPSERRASLAGRPPLPKIVP
jgi:4-amino-4-deoxy-L-arabinose transferase-like glycosyltransferase